MDSPYANELRIAIGVVQKAAQLGQSIIASNDKGTVEKHDHSPVTVADFAIQALLVATFKAAFPDDVFVGEEDASDLRAKPDLLDRVWGLLEGIGGDEDARALCRLPRSKEHLCDLVDQCGANKPGRGRTWVFDPIDGTQNYVSRKLYAINIGLLLDGKQQLGVVGCPNMSIEAAAPFCDTDVDPTGTGCIIFAVKDHGTHIRALPGSLADTPTRRLPRNSSSAIKFLTSTTVESCLPNIHEKIARSLSTPYPNVDLLPWVLRWAVLALGLGNTTVWVYKKRARYGKVWDHSGAMLLFEETGGKITDVHGKDIDLTVERKMVGNFGLSKMSRYDVLVTGSSGHLGTALMLSLPSLGFTPFGIDILPSPTTNRVGSISERNFVTSLFEEFTFKHVLHAATLHKPHICSHTNQQFVETNITGTLNLLETSGAKTLGKLESFVFFSTTSTFGMALSPQPGAPAAWIDEHVVPLPKNVYGITKVAAEDMCYLIHKQLGLPVLVLRTSRFFPEADDDEDRRTAMEDDNLKVLELAYRRCDIADIVSATVCAMKKASEIRWGKYIISAPPPFSNDPGTLAALDRNPEEVFAQ
ncbi:hypothetical protein S40293_03276, partial [Stachybotrys chartarum IBT 40293]